MKAKIEYQLKISVRESNGSKLIDKKAIEEGHTDKKLIYSEQGFDSTWRDSKGNDVTSGYRMCKDGVNCVLITITNSYFNDQKHSEQVIKFINND